MQSNRLQSLCSFGIVTNSTIHPLFMRILTIPIFVVSRSSECSMQYVVGDLPYLLTNV